MDPYDAIIPVFLETDASEEVVLVGSCVFVSIDGQNFLRTAAHVTDHADEDHVLLIPGHTHLIQLEGKSAELGRRGERSQKSSDLDVSYIHLDREFVECMDPDYHPIAPDGLGMLDRAQRGGLYTITGYPERASNVTKGQCSAEFFALTGMVPDPQFYRKLRYRPDMHILTKFNIRRNKILRGNAQSTPQPFGMSGGGVFSWPRNANRFAPNPEPKLVGIAVHWHPRHAIFAATRIWCFFECIEKNNPSLIRLIPIDAATTPTSP